MIFGYPYLEKQNMAGRQTQIGRSMISLWSNTLIEDIQANHGWLLKSISMKLITFILGWWSFLSWRIYNQWVDILGIYNYIYIYIYIYICMCTPSVIPSIWIWMHLEKEVCTTRKPKPTYSITRYLNPLGLWWAYILIVPTWLLVVFSSSYHHHFLTDIKEPHIFSVVPVTGTVYIYITTVAFTPR